MASYIIYSNYLLFLLFADIDECQSGRSNCSQTCTNTFGSFTCGCMPGYSLQEDGVTCTGMHAAYKTFVQFSVCVSVRI